MRQLPRPPPPSVDDRRSPPPTAARRARCASWLTHGAPWPRALGGRSLQRIALEQDRQLHSEAQATAVRLAHENIAQDARLYEVLASTEADHALMELWMTLDGESHLAGWTRARAAPAP